MFMSQYNFYDYSSAAAQSANKFKLDEIKIGFKEHQGLNHIEKINIQLDFIINLKSSNLNKLIQNTLFEYNVIFIFM